MKKFIKNTANSIRTKAIRHAALISPMRNSAPCRTDATDQPPSAPA